MIGPTRLILFAMCRGEKLGLIAQTLVNPAPAPGDLGRHRSASGFGKYLTRLIGSFLFLDWIGFC
jgi:hypothetical protein